MLPRSVAIIVVGFVLACGRTPLSVDESAPFAPDAPGSPDGSSSNGGGADSGSGGSVDATLDVVVADSDAASDAPIGAAGDAVASDALPETSDESCVPLTCADQGYQCGRAGDGCGHVIQCGTCPCPQYCGGGGFNVCGGNDSIPPGCSTDPVCWGKNCGASDDGCGGIVQCGSCPAGETCGAGGPPFQCGDLDAGACAPLTCTDQGIECGLAGDGCGGEIECGTCTRPDTCGGSFPGKCGPLYYGACTPCPYPGSSSASCEQQGIECGPAGDGCGNEMFTCGTCTPPETCGGGGVPGRCGLGADGGAGCVPLGCAQQNIQCGPAGDGCGDQIDCGTCAPPATCGGGGILWRCGCTPQSCADQGIQCGPADDGCGQPTDCGTCTPPATCAGSGFPGRCGTGR